MGGSESKQFHTSCRSLLPVKCWMNLPFMLTSLGTISEKRKSLWVHGLSDGDDDDDDDDGENGDHRQAALHWTDKHVNASSKKNNGWISTSLSLLCCNLPGFYSQEFILLCPTKAATDNCFTGELLKYHPSSPQPFFFIHLTCHCGKHHGNMIVL